MIFPSELRACNPSTIECQWPQKIVWFTLKKRGFIRWASWHYIKQYTRYNIPGRQYTRCVFGWRRGEMYFSRAPPQDHNNNIIVLGVGSIITTMMIYNGLEFLTFKFGVVAESDDTPLGCLSCNDIPPIRIVRLVFIIGWWGRNFFIGWMGIGRKDEILRRGIRLSLWCSQNAFFNQTLYATNPMM